MDNRLLRRMLPPAAGTGGTGDGLRKPEKKWKIEASPGKRAFASRWLVAG